MAVDEERLRRAGFGVGVALGVGMRAMGVPPQGGRSLLPGETLAAYRHRLIEEGPTMPDDPVQAIKDLRAALTMGSLKIITAELAPGASPSPDPTAYVQHAVVSLAPLPGHDGLWIAHSVEGDAMIGAPSALLRRLQHWRR